ncbi:MAG: PAS domain-containing protein, partial [Acidimicrobiales bacterium]
MQPPWSDLLLGLVVLPALGMLIAKARTFNGSMGWRLLTVGSVLIAFAPLFSEIHRSISPGIGPLTAGDAVLMAGYGLFIGGLRAVLTARTMAPQIRVALDAMVISLWVGFLTLAWAGPQLVDRLEGYPLLASLIYLPFSLAIVFLIFQLTLGSDSRSAAVWLLSAAAGLTVFSELNFLAVAAGEDGARQVGVGSATLGLVVVAGAIRHPSGAELEVPVAGIQRPLRFAHSVYLLTSFVGIAAALVILPDRTPALNIMLGALGVATAANLGLTVRERERLIAVEQQLRHSVSEVMRADSPDKILQLGALAVDRVLADKNLAESEFLLRAKGQWEQVPGGVAVSLDDETRAALEVVRSAGTLLRSEQASDYPGIAHTTRLGVGLELATSHTDLLLVEASPVLTTTEIEQIQQIVSTVDRTLLGYEQHEESHHRRSDQRFRALVHDSADVICLIDPESRQVQMVSPSVERILGYGEDYFLDLSVLTFVHPDETETIEQLLRNSLTKPQQVGTDIRLRHIDGHFHWFSLNVRDHTADEEVRGLVMNFTDIQDRKMAELSLGFSEHRYRTLVLNSKDVFAILETDLTI